MDYFQLLLSDKSLKGHAEGEAIAELKRLCVLILLSKPPL